MPFRWPEFDASTVAVDRGVQHQRIIFIARDLGGDELAQKGAEGLGILTSDRTQVLDATERVECDCELATVLGGWLLVQIARET
jgi:hypothetical protein